MERYINQQLGKDLQLNPQQTEGRIERYDACPTIYYINMGKDSYVYYSREDRDKDFNKLIGEEVE